MFPSVVIRFTLNRWPRRASRQGLEVELLTADGSGTLSRTEHGIDLSTDTKHVSKPEPLLLGPRLGHIWVTTDEKQRKTMQDEIHTKRQFTDGSWMLCLVSESGPKTPRTGLSTLDL